MPRTAITVKNLSKQYRLGQVGTGSLSHDLNRWWHRVRGKEDPYLKVGAINDPTAERQDTYVWALRDINFEVQEGEILGIIGKNGAGKSTLLKILAKVTGPTSGIVKAKGRIAALLEVGTGFHGELTGRENIYLNGTILGMTRKEVTKKLDEIVTFAGIGLYLDTPVKRYSSGMKVRLGFAVAAHLEPEILIVDEVLAVGDAEFQRRCVGKMGEISSQTGRTILFVSHQLDMVKSLCHRTILLDKGQIKAIDKTDKIVDHYLTWAKDNQQLHAVYQERENPQLQIQILEIKVLNRDGEVCNSFDMFEPIHLQIRYKVNQPIKGGVTNFELNSSKAILFLSFDTDDNPELTETREVGLYQAAVKLPAGIFKPDIYTLTFHTGIPNITIFQKLKEVVQFEVQLLSKPSSVLSYAKWRKGIIPSPAIWETTKVG